MYADTLASKFGSLQSPGLSVVIGKRLFYVSQFGSLQTYGSAVTEVGLNFLVQVRNLQDIPSSSNLQDVPDTL